MRFGTFLRTRGPGAPPPPQPPKNYTPCLSAPHRCRGRCDRLEYGSPYAFRLIAENADGTDTSFTETFTTLPAAPTVTATSVKAIYSETAEIHAQIEPGGGDLPPTTSNTSPPNSSNETKKKVRKNSPTPKKPQPRPARQRHPQGLTARLSGLKAGTTYHYRVVAENATKRSQVSRTPSPPSLSPRLLDLPQCPCTPADRRRQAPRLPRLRARLRAQRRRL